MAIFIIVFLGIITNIMCNYILNNVAPEKQTQAVLASKKTGTYMDANNVIHTNYILEFDVLGERKKFIVKHNVYKMYFEGQQGKLVNKRKKFVDFIC